MTDTTNTCGEGAELKPLSCPFCGNKVAEQSFWYGGRDNEAYYVFCLECSQTETLVGPVRPSVCEAVEAWNTRVVSPTQQAAKTGEGADRIEIAFPELNDHLIRMASTGSVGSLTEWGDFFNCLRSALADPRALTAGEAAISDRELHYLDALMCAGGIVHNAAAVARSGKNLELLPDVLDRDRQAAVERVAALADTWSDASGPNVKLKVSSAKEIALDLRTILANLKPGEA